jgi:hypothetical protein
MISISISGKRKNGQSLADFYHEFEHIHVNLMRKARCERFIKRYSQNKAVKNWPPMELLAATDKAYDSQASLCFDGMEAMENFFNDEEYKKILKPHEFTDPNYMTFELANRNVMKVKNGKEESIKLIYYLKPQTAVTRDDFAKFMDSDFSDVFIRPKRELLASHVRSYCIPLEAQNFANTAFKNAKISYYGVIEELEFADLEKMKIFHEGFNLKHNILGKYLDDANSFSLIVTEKVVFGEL